MNYSRKLLITALLTVSALLNIGCFRSNTQTCVVSVPNMTDHEDYKTVFDSVAQLRGIVDIEIDEEMRNIIVTYDSLVIAKKNIEVAIAKAGYDANSIM